MIRLTKDKPESNLETALNFAFVNDKEAWLRTAPSKKLADYVAEACTERRCEMSAEDIIEDGLMDCYDCPIGILYTIGVQAAELRERLKAYEDTGLEPEEIKSLQAEWRANLSALAGYRNAKAEGRLLALPCKVGGEVIRIALINTLAAYFCIGDSYTYELTRSKQSFAAGTVSLDDFAEWGDDEIVRLTDYILLHFREEAERALEGGRT